MYPLCTSLVTSYMNVHIVHSVTAPELSDSESGTAHQAVSTFWAHCQRESLRKSIGSPLEVHWKSIGCDKVLLTLRSWDDIYVQREYYHEPLSSSNLKLTTKDFVFTGLRASRIDFLRNRGWVEQSSCKDEVRTKLCSKLVRMPFQGSGNNSSERTGSRSGWGKLEYRLNTVI